MLKYNKDNVELEFDLPQFKKSDINVDIKDNEINISAEKTNEKKVNKKDFFHQEKSFHSFSYSSTIPNVNSKKAKTKFTKGVLKISAPKK